ncbi:TRIC cation channel family protein [Mycobacterium sp. SM1]|uniref:protein UsfY n=1 Tax=Mycobacterium sp. SM1 TaxID=2816243 RepID=UPI001BCC8457|nr:protein UsfY [Mycobacterium sp. SM1]MBS4727610.1 TRIC cation channel family protein [Mycobacterium sp. SM1]
MGDTHHDPIDHFRTTGQHAGEFFVDIYCWPGLISIALGAFSLVGCLAAAAYGHQEWIPTTAVVGVLAIGGGISWLILEHRRVLRIETRWLTAQQASKPTVPPLAPSRPFPPEDTASQRRPGGLASRNRFESW